MSKVCFIISPLGPPDTEIRMHSDFMLELVTPVLEKFDYQVVRADKISSVTVITTDIIQLLVDADLVIADITGRNPNVLYELGVRHSTGKPFIQVAREGESLPFDIAGIRTIYADLASPRTARAFVETISKFIGQIESAPDSQANPLSLAAADKKIFEDVIAKASDININLSATEASIVDAVRSVEKRMASLEDSILSRSESDVSKTKISRKVFIVHGHDGELKEQVARFLEKLDFQPIILHEQPDKGQTIIEKLGSNTNDIGFAFILLTPDDVGAVKSEAEKLNPRARQNVVFEHGLFVAQLGRSRVCALLKGGVEIPSDLSGVLYKEVPEKGGVESIKFDLVQELRAAGFDADANLLLNLGANEDT